MKKILFVSILLLLSPFFVFALDDCSFGKTDSSCQSPGECGSYEDVDGNEICDHSQVVLTGKDDNNLDVQTGEEESDLISGKDLKTKTVGEIAQLYQIAPDRYAEKIGEFYKVKVNSSDSFQRLHDNYGVEPSVAKEIAGAIKKGQKIPLSSKENKVKNGKSYHLIPIMGSLIFLYLIILFLSKKSKITGLSHRRIWNILLLITFLISGLLGVLLIIKVNFGLVFSLPFNILFWHVEIGIAMFAISLIHIVERWNFFKGLFLKK